MVSIDFDFRRLEIFCKVVELESFSKAAEAVFLTQPTVSDRIASLEEMVGAKLLDRLGRQVKPTRAGERLYRHAVALLALKRTTALEMEAFLGLKQGELSMGGSTIPGEYILPGVIGAFNAKYPEVMVVLSIADTATIARRVIEGKLELGVIGSPVKDANLIQTELWQDELVLAIPVRHRWAKRESISIAELPEAGFILREAGSGTLKIIETCFHNAQLPPPDQLRVVARLGSSTAIKEGVKAGLGVSILSARAIAAERKAGLISSVRIEGMPIKRRFYSIRDKRRTASPLCRTMLAFLAENKRLCA